MKCWRQKSGVIPISEMTDRHLRNSIKLLERRHDDQVSASFGFASTLTGDMATYYADQECDRLVDVGPQGMFSHDWPWATYNDLVEEARRRLKLRGRGVLYP